MEKRHLERLEEFTKKLATASDKEAYRILTKCEALIEKAKIDLAKKDFSLYLPEAIFQVSYILPKHGCNIDIKRNIRIRIFRFQKQQLRDNRVRHLGINIPIYHNNTVTQ